jgi:hypothetical protein
MIQQQQSTGKQQITWNAEGLPTGMYFLTIATGGVTTTRTIAVVR